MYRISLSPFNITQWRDSTGGSAFLINLKSQNNMDNYIMLNGKKIPLFIESPNNIEKSLQPILIGKNDSCYDFVDDSDVQIGRGSVSKDLKGRCLVVKDGIRIVVEDNDSFIFTKRILFFKE